MLSGKSQRMFHVELGRSLSVWANKIHLIPTQKRLQGPSSRANFVPIFLALKFKLFYLHNVRTDDVCWLQPGQKKNLIDPELLVKEGKVTRIMCHGCTCTDRRGALWVSVGSCKSIWTKLNNKRSLMIYHALKYDPFLNGGRENNICCLERIKRWWCFPFKWITDVSQKLQLLADWDRSVPGTETSRS